MMQNSANILPAANTESFRDRNASLPSHSPGQAGESFDALMSRAMSPATPDKNSPTTPNDSADPGTERRNTFSTHKPQRSSPAQNKAAKDADIVKTETDSRTLQEESGAKTDGKTGAKTTGDNSDKTHNTPALIEAVVVPDNSQNPIIQMLTPALAVYLPTAFAPTLAANNATTPTDSISNSQEEAVGGGKTPAPAAGTAAGVVVPTNPLTTEAVPGLNADEQKKIAVINKTQAAQKIIPAEAKASGTTTASAEALKLKSVDASSSDLTPQNVAAAEPLPSPEIFTASASGKETEALAAFQTHGTPAAKLDVPMKKDDNTIKVAGPGEQVLPGEAAAVAPQRNLPGRGNFIVPVSAGAATADSTAAANSLTAGQTMTATSASSDTLVSSQIIDLPARALERTHDMVSLHALRMVEVKSDSLQVVIKPGAGIQLSLELRQRGDGIEAQAVLQQGDFNQMNQHWAELQQRLEQRGIRLAPLTGDENSATSSGNSEFQKQQRPPVEQDSLAAGAFAEFALAGAMIAQAGQPATHDGAQRGWQTWA